MPQERKKKQFSVRVYDQKHLRNLSKRLRKVQALIDEAARKGAAIGARTGYKDIEKDFRFDDFPQARREIDALLRELSTALTMNVEEADSEAWGMANAKNDAMVDAMLASTGVDMARKTTQPWYNKNARALGAFKQRVKDGMGLSTDVWNLGQFKGELELALEMGLGRGKSAAELSRDVRSFLKYPDKLFRRVRDEKGVLRLSKAAREFHPGRGVYRSSYKNALRVTATETNMAYRTADSKRWQQIPFVLGIKIQVSKTNHPVTDICDELAGDYPKDFVFTGWHPFCKCFATSILPAPEKFLEYQQAILDGKDVSDWQWEGEVKDVPGEFNKWVKDNEERIAKAKSMPYFIKENFTDGNPNKGLRWKEPKKLTPMEIAAQRHAARTPEQVLAIESRWNERRRVRRIAKETLEMANQYAAIDKIPIGVLESAYNAGSVPVMRTAAKYLRKSLIPLRRAELELQRVERRMLSDSKLTSKQQTAIKRRIRMTREYLRNETDILDIQGHGTPITVKGLKSRINNILNWFKPATQKQNTLQNVVGYVKTQAAKDYETKKATWTHKENYHLEKTEERTMRDGKKYKCDIYITPGGTKIVVPKSLPKTYHLTVQDVADALEKLPVELKAQTKEIHLVNFLNPEDATIWKKRYKNFTQSYATGGNGTITFYKTPNGWTRADAQADLPFTLSHENGHNIDRYHEKLNGNKPSETKEWKDAMTADKTTSGQESMRSYGKNSEHEDFADAIGYFVHMPGWFKANFPERYKIISRLLGIS